MSPKGSMRVLCLRQLSKPPKFLVPENSLDRVRPSTRSARHVQSRNEIHGPRHLKISSRHFEVKSIDVEAVVVVLEEASTTNASKELLLIISLAELGCTRSRMAPFANTEARHFSIRHVSSFGDPAFRWSL